VLSNWLRLIVGALIVLVVIYVGAHFIFILKDAPIETRWGFFNIFVSTFAAALLTFFGGILLFDYQSQVTNAAKKRLLSSLLVTDLTETIEALDPSNAVEIRLSNDPTVVKVVIIQLQPSVIEEAVRSSFDPSRDLDHSYSVRVLRLAKRMAEYNAKIFAFLNLLSQGTAAEASIKDVVLHTAQNLEQLREAIVEECDLLIRHAETQNNLGKRVSEQ
jgi:hypothetical protein